MAASSLCRFGLSCRRIRPQLVGADHRSDSDELRDLLSIELSEFRQFGDDRADGDWSDAFDRVQDFDFAGVGLIGMLFLIHEIQDLPPSFHEKRFIATSGFHDNNGVGSVSDGFDPLRELLFIVANGLNIRARSLCGSCDGSGLK